VGGLGSARDAETKIEPSPHITSVLGTSSQNDADAWD
jgi:hypothetical protein